MCMSTYFLVQIQYMPDTKRAWKREPSLVFITAHCRFNSFMQKLPPFHDVKSFSTKFTSTFNEKDVIMNRNICNSAHVGGKQTRSVNQRLYIAGLYVCLQAVGGNLILPFSIFPLYSTYSLTGGKRDCLTRFHWLSKTRIYNL